MATLLHVDMDAFFAAVEVRLDPSLAGMPVVVGGTGRRGVVAAASYEARAYGVRSAMPTAQARRLCPQAIFRPGRYDTYGEISQQIHQVFHAYTPLVEPIALDEAFLDVSGALAYFGDGRSIGGQIRDELRAQLGLSASVGVAATKFVAKLASEAAKPRASRAGVVAGAGVVVIASGEELAFLHPLAVEALWGVGPVTASRLRALGVATIGELAAIPLDTLERAVGSAHGAHLHDLAWGRDPRPVQVDRAVQSVGHEETYPVDRTDAADLHREVVRMSEAVARRLRAAGVTGRTVTLKLRYGDFTTITRSQTLRIGIDTGPAVARAASWLLEQVDVDRGVRLLGVSVANLAEHAPRQLALTLDGDGGLATASSDSASAAMASESADLSWREAARAVDEVRARFGERAVGPAALLEPEGLRLKRPGEHQWGPTGPGSPGDDSRR